MALVEGRILQNKRAQPRLFQIIQEEISLFWAEDAASS
jgi:hypothetical protein